MFGSFYCLSQSETNVYRSRFSVIHTINTRWKFLRVMNYLRCVAYFDTCKNWWTKLKFNRSIYIDSRNEINSHFFLTNKQKKNTKKRITTNPKNHLWKKMHRNYFESIGEVLAVRYDTFRIEFEELLGSRVMQPTELSSE